MYFDPWERYEGVSSPMGFSPMGGIRLVLFAHGRGKGGVFSPFAGARGCHFISGRGHGSVISPMGGVMHGGSFHPEG